jgi:single-strand DNA-binding protein
MLSFCKAILTRDPETRFTAAGLAIVSFGIAVNGGFGEKEEVSFIDCTSFGKQGEALPSFHERAGKSHDSGRLRQEH